MKIKKTDLAITFNTDNNHYQILARKTFLLFFSKWVILTALEAENSEETPIEFDTLSDTERFIDVICKKINNKFGN